MANSEDCGTRGSSGWNVYFTTDGGYVLEKNDAGFVLYTHDEVRGFLRGYGAACDEFDEKDVTSGSNVDIGRAGDEGYLQKLDRLLMESGLLKGLSK